MSDRDAELEALADGMTDEQIQEQMEGSSDLILGRMAGVADARKELLCGGVKEAEGETDGICRTYNAALKEFDSRMQNTTPSR